MGYKSYKYNEEVEYRQLDFEFIEQEVYKGLDDTRYLLIEKLNADTFLLNNAKQIIIGHGVKMFVVVSKTSGEELDRGIQWDFGEYLDCYYSDIDIEKLRDEYR